MIGDAINRGHLLGSLALPPLTLSLHVMRGRLVAPVSVLVQSLSWEMAHRVMEEVLTGHRDRLVWAHRVLTAMTASYPTAPPLLLPPSIDNEDDDEGGVYEGIRAMFDGETEMGSGSGPTTTATSGSTSHNNKVRRCGGCGIGLAVGRMVRWVRGRLLLLAPKHNKGQECQG